VPYSSPYLIRKHYSSIRAKKEKKSAANTIELHKFCLYLVGKIGRGEGMSQYKNLLEERLKELKCLFRISELVDYFEDDLESILQGIIKIIPESWQYPDITEVKVVLDGKSYVSPDYKETAWIQRAKVKCNGMYIGEISVCYTEKRDEQYEGPFLEDERILLNAVAERLGRITERIRSKELLKLEEEALQKKNTAMVEVLSQVRTENEELARRIHTNIDNIVVPILEKLEKSLENTVHEYSLRLARQNLQEIVSPLYTGLSKDFSNLSPKELQVCNMIYKGFASKEIAQIRNVAPSTVNRHRENIRRKLGLTIT